MELQSSFDCIPQLGPKRPDDMVDSLLEERGGIVGYEYYQCPMSHRVKAQNDGWESAKRGLYTIKGPLGSIDCELLRVGRVIPGSDGVSNRRKCWVHKSIPEITGLNLKTGKPEDIEELTKPEPPVAGASRKATKAKE